MFTVTKIAVLVKFYNGEISPFDESALECALSSDAEVTVFTLAPESVKEKLSYFTRLGADAVLITDKVFAGADTLVTAKILAKTLSFYDFDYVLCGRQSLNGDTAQVPPELSVLSGYDFIPYVTGFSLVAPVTRFGVMQVKGKTIMSVERIKTLRYASIFSKPRPIKVIDNSVLEFKEDETGYKGSPTKVIKTYEREKKTRSCRFIDFNDLEKVITSAAAKKGAVISPVTKCEKKLPLCFYAGNDLKEIAEKIAEKSVKIDESDNFDFKEKAFSAAKFIKSGNPDILLMPSTSDYRVIAPMTAAKLGIGLCADCTALRVENGKLVMTRPALSGNTYAEIISESKITAATVRAGERSGKIVFGIGYGAKNNIIKIKKLAEKFGAEVVASRKIVDCGLMPYETQVGLTGKIISPDVYVAFGISGAIQHLVGIENAKTIIAVNKDKKEKIFDNADYGIVREL